jgi:hypothetical protein
MAIVDDVPGALALLSRTSHARSFGGGPIPPMVALLGVPKGTAPLAPRRKDRRSLDDAVRWL